MESTSTGDPNRRIVIAGPFRRACSGLGGTFQACCR